jgi:hypothetical protein
LVVGGNDFASGAYLPSLAENHGEDAVIAESHHFRETHVLSVFGFDHTHVTEGAIRPDGFNDETDHLLHRTVDFEKVDVPESRETFFPET